jgi:flagellar basal body-associated protein FliL
MPQPQHTEPQYAQAQHTPAQYDSPPPKKKRKTALWVILGLVVLLFGGCTALVVAGIALTASGGVEEATEALEEATEGIEQAGETVSPAETIDTTTAETDLEVVGGDEALDAGVCTRLDSETMTIAVTNNSPKTSSYFLTVGYFDAGQRVADSTELLNHLRPGEQSLETFILFDVPAGDCEVIEVERFASESAPGEMAELSPCEVADANVLGHMTATVTATNGTPETSNYSVEVAFVNSEGVRVGNGFAFIEAVRAGESAPSEIFSVLDEQPGLTCDVVAVIRNASN